MARYRFSNIRLALLLCAVCLVIFAGVYRINKATVDGLLTQNAKTTSTSVAEYFGKSIPDIEDIIGGAAPSAQSLQFITAAAEARDVDIFKLYNLDGKLAFDTQQIDPKQAIEDALGSHNPDALKAIRDSRPFTTLEVEHNPGGDEFVAETYVPVMRHGKLIGGAEVYLNQTPLAESFRKSFAWVSILIAMLAAAGFAIPAYGFHVRSRQKSAADESVQFLANHDAVTGLPNRSNFVSQLDAYLAAAKDKDQLVALHHIDLDHFKDINDRYGHAFGDEMLRAVAERLRGLLRNGDIISRFTGNEFVVVQFGIAGYEQLASATQRFITVFREPFSIREEQIVLTASVGTSVGTPHDATADTLITNGDTAVYVVKARGRNGHCFFEPKFNDEKLKRMNLEVLVRDAVAKKSFELHFQPLISLSESRIKGFEALLRLRNNEGQYVSPAEFIPVAEDTGLIDEIGSWVLEHGCRAAALWPNDLQISINLSVAQFKRHSVVAATRDALQNSGLAASRLLLEITESLLLSETDSVIAQLRELKGMGASVVMDDFGTGYSSLGYMLKFPFDRIKIDRSFINEMSNGNNSARTVIQTIVALGHTLNMNVTAEGVETMAQAEALADMRCDDAQGYVFGRPMPESDVAALLMRTFATEIAGPTVARRDESLAS